MLSSIPMKESVISLNVDVITLNKSPYRERVDERVKEAILISVFNEGDIIPEDKLEEVFEPFYRLKNTKSQQGNRDRSKFQSYDHAPAS